MNITVSGDPLVELTLAEHQPPAACRCAPLEPVLEMVQRLNDIVGAAELWRFARPFAVCGGAIRDLLRGQEPADVDVWVQCSNEDDVEYLATEIRLTTGGNLHKYIFHSSRWYDLGQGESFPCHTLVGRKTPSIDVIPTLRRPSGTITLFDYTVNCCAVTYPRVSTFIHHPEFFSDLNSGVLRALGDASGYRQERMIYKGFHPLRTNQGGT